MRRHAISRAVPLVVAATAVFGAFGCGSDDPPEAPSPTTDAAAPTEASEAPEPSTEAFCAAWEDVNPLAGETVEVPPEFEAGKAAYLDTFEQLTVGFSDAASVAPPEVRDDVLVAVALFEEATERMRDATNIRQLVAASEVLNSSVVASAGKRVRSYMRRNCE